MHDRDARLVEMLENCNFDRARLSDADVAEAFSLARAAQIELWRPGMVWPSSDGASLRGGAVTHVDARLF